MRIKSFIFSKIQKNPLLMESEINEFLQNVSLKTATLTESVKRGKIVLTVGYTSSSRSKIICKVFRAIDPREMEEQINKFLDQGNDLKLMLSSYPMSHITTIVFYIPKDNENENTSKPPQTSTEEDKKNDGAKEGDSNNENQNASEGKDGSQEEEKNQDS